MDKEQYDDLKKTLEYLIVLVKGISEHLEVGKIKSPADLKKAPFDDNESDVQPEIIEEKEK